MSAPALQPRPHGERGAARQIEAFDSVDTGAAEQGAPPRAALLVLVAMMGVAGVLAPLTDPDLAMHLATGEWVARHGTVPFVEPFAWTRPGEPFYAYSWGVELLYYLVLRAAGPLGLHALQGVLFAAAAGSVAALGRAARWSAWTTLFVVVLHMTVVMGVAPFLRPQLLLLILIPLAWALSIAAWRAPSLRAPDGWRPLVGLALVGCIVANTHLLFPLTAVPAGLVVLSAPRLDVRRAAAMFGALAAGWLISPYGLSWPAVFRQNFGGNALLAFPSPILEYQPGFVHLNNGWALPTIFILALLPWAMGGADALTTRQRVWYGIAWLVGLVAFAKAQRALLVWWVAMLPVVALLLDRIPAPEEATRRVRVMLLYAIAAVMVVRMVAWARPVRGMEGTLASRTLATRAGTSLEPLVACVEGGTRAGTSGRILTISEFGGYLTWRLPAYQRSIDGRTIFPDSVAKAEAYLSAYTRDPRPLGPWESADLALLPLKFPTGAVLDTALGWHRLATNDTTSKGVVPSAVWVRDEWWAAAGGRPDAQCARAAAVKK